jgi:alkanesulfonate monooxygenase SsuD/methylene tetrahydromethanopterin reductase-like flavin-dependent oxidoreductase (luciferase family)
MKLGAFMFPHHNSARGLDYWQMYDEDLQAGILLDRLGYEELWVGEHTTHRMEPITNSLQFLSALLPLTRDMKLCTGVLNLPQHHPARVAADVAMFDHMAKGRMIVGIGPGGLITDFEAFGTTELDRQAMLIESADMIEKLWAGEAPYELNGQFWRINISDVNRDIGFATIPTPYQKPFPPFCVSAMSPFSGTAKLAGEKGWNLLSATFNHGWILKSHFTAWRSGREKAGLPADPSAWRISRNILITETDAEAEDYLADPGNIAQQYYEMILTGLRRANYVEVLTPARGSDPEKITGRSLVDSLVLSGSVQTVTDRLVALIDEVGPFGTLLATVMEWDRPQMWRRSLELLKTEVMPRIADYSRSVTKKVA